MPVEDVFGDPIVDPITGENVENATVLTPALIDTLFLSDRFRLQAGFSSGRNSASWECWVTRRDYTAGELDTFVNQMRLSYSRRLSRRLSASAAVRLWDHNEDEDAGFDSWQDGIDFRVNYRLGRRSNLESRLERQKRASDAPNSSFSENRISMSFRMRL